MLVNLRLQILLFLLQHIYIALHPCLLLVLGVPQLVQLVKSIDGQPGIVEGSPWSHLGRQLDSEVSEFVPEPVEVAFYLRQVEFLFVVLALDVWFELEEHMEVFFEIAVHKFKNI